MEIMRFRSSCFQLKNVTPVFFKLAFFFQNICFKVNAMKTFKNVQDCYIKTCQSVKRKNILKIQRTYALFIGFKTKSL